MERERRKRREPAAPDLPLPGPGEVPEPDPPTAVHVTWGAMVHDHELQGLTVGEVFQLLRGPWNIADGVDALVNGVAARHDHVLGPADRLEFTRESGQKGSA